MGLFIKQDENRSELQQRIAAELQQKAVSRAKAEDRPDLVDDSEYIKGTKATTSLAGVWIAIILVAVGIAIWLMALSIANNQ
jgi:F0F1-type ATP synthase assembly protein I